MKINFEVAEDTLSGVLVVTGIISLFWLMTSCMADNGTIFDKAEARAQRKAELYKEHGP